MMLCSVVAAQEMPISSDDPVPVAILSTDPIVLQRFRDAIADVEIDGHINEQAWRDVPTYGDLRVLRPDTLASVPYETNVRLFYTEKGLYVSFDMEQPSETIIKRLTPRDVLGVNREYVSITLDTSGEGRYGYWMNLALGDNQIDGTILPERQYDMEWDGAWHGATQMTERGWSAEYFIPWSQIAMPKMAGDRRIGLYVSRRVAHLNETWGWPTLPRSSPRFMSSLQPLEMTGVDPRQQWNLFPYVSSTYDGIVGDASYRAGIDLFWRPSSSLQFTATANPDFGAVESDDVVVNLTADETFFPEKRLFFQEGREIFRATARSDPGNEQALIIVNTRRIGGRPQPFNLPPGVTLPPQEQFRTSDLVGAGKVTGQTGSVRYGLLGAWENDTEFMIGDLEVPQKGRSFGAVRILYEDDIGAAYRGLGFISTLTAHTGAVAQVNGIDLHYLSGAGVWNLEGQVLSSTSDNRKTGYGAFADIDFVPRQGLKHSLALSSFDENIDINDLGFQIRNNFREAWYRIEWIRSGLTGIRDFRIAPSFRYQENGDGFRTNYMLASDFEFTFNNLNRVDIFTAHFPRQFDDRNSFGNGSFEVEARNSFNITYTTDTARPISGVGEVGHFGEARGGHSWQTKAGIVWRPQTNLNMALKIVRQDRSGWLLHQDGGNFTSFNARQWQPEIIAEYFPTAHQQLRLVLQWAGIRAFEDEFFLLPEGSNALDRVPKPEGPTDDFGVSQLNFQIRYRWQIAPLSDFFIVYSRADIRRVEVNAFQTLLQDSWDDPVRDQLVVKVRYRFGS
ncbi:MAG: DUF5916 domain-containing protein [Proteobacteria bacterium]|nr:DUF5916 domain-containing protein [Pseudomonadota bacterium]